MTLRLNDAVTHRPGRKARPERPDGPGSTRSSGASNSQPGEAPSYAYTLYDSIRDIDVHEWTAAGASGLMMDPRFLSVVEATMADDLRVWHVIFRDGSRPVGCASFGLYRTDLATLASPKTRNGLNRVRRAFPGFAYVRVLFCGLPISIGQKAVGFSEECDRPQIVRAISQIMDELARAHRARVLVAKEFTEQECDSLDTLISRGFFRAATPNLNVMERKHENFSEYSAALKSSYRSEVKRSLKKLADSGLKIERIRGGDLVAQTYTDQMHALYEAVFHNAENKLEILPPSFFRSLAMDFPENVSLTLISGPEGVVAFMYSIAFLDCYYFMFCGIDYSRNRESDLYFNLFYKDMDNWLRDGLPVLKMGQSSDDLKARLGCTAVHLFCYVKVTGFLRPIVMANIDLLFPRPKDLQPRDIFKRAS